MKIVTAVVGGSPSAASDSEMTSSTSGPQFHTTQVTLTVKNDESKSFGMSINGRCVVCNMASDGLAAAAGVRVGDHLLSFNAIDISSEDTLFAAMRAVPNGDEVTFVVSRKSVMPENQV